MRDVQVREAGEAVARPLAFVYDRNATLTREMLQLRLEACAEYAKVHGRRIGGWFVDEGNDAIIHTGMCSTVSVAWNGKRVRVEVADNSLRLPQYGNDHDPERRGRGMYLVRELAWDLGYYPAAPGKVVWCEFSAHTAPTQDARLAAMVRVAHARVASGLTHIP